MTGRRRAGSISGQSPVVSTISSASWACAAPRTRPSTSSSLPRKQPIAEPLGQRHDRLRGRPPRWSRSRSRRALRAAAAARPCAPAAACRPPRSSTLPGSREEVMRASIVQTVLIASASRVTSVSAATARREIAAEHLLDPVRRDAVRRAGPSGENVTGSEPVAGGQIAREAQRARAARPRRRASLASTRLMPSPSAASVASRASTISRHVCGVIANAWSGPSRPLSSVKCFSNTRAPSATAAQHGQVPRRVVGEPEHDVGMHGGASAPRTERLTWRKFSGSAV